MISQCNQITMRPRRTDFSAACVIVLEIRQYSCVLFLAGRKNPLRLGSKILRENAVRVPREARLRAYCRMVRPCDKAGADVVPRKTHCNLIALTKHFA